MAFDVHVLPAHGPPPTVEWRWDAETEILSAAFLPATLQSGFNGPVELNDEDGSVAVVDVAGGVLCGLDLVVWPEVVVLDGLAAPVEARDGVVIVPSRSARRAATTGEFDTTLSLASDPGQRTLHLRIGTRRAVEPVRIADKLLVEVDASLRLAGFWLEQVPLPGVG